MSLGRQLKGVIRAMLTPLDEMVQVVYEPIPKFVENQKEGLSIYLRQHMPLSFDEHQRENRLLEIGYLARF
jgi:hypothetical protein